MRAQFDSNSSPPARRRAPWCLRLAILLAASSVSIGVPFLSAAPPGAVDKAAADVAKPAELFLLKNDDLLRQADAIFAKASEAYLAQLRNLAAVEVSLQDVDAQAEALQPRPTPAAPPGPAATPRPAPAAPGVDSAEKKTSPTEAASAAVDAAKAKQDLAARRRRLVLAKQALLGRLSTGLDARNLAALAFQHALDDLAAYSVEIGLRVKDGTLAPTKVGGEWKPGALEKRRKDLLADQASQKARADALHHQEESIAKEIEAADKAVLVADAESSIATKKLAQQQKRQEMEIAIAGRKPEDLLAELIQLVDEGHGLKGTFDLDLRRFQSRVAEVAGLEKDLAGLKPPETKAGPTARAETPEQAASSTRELLGFYEKRAKRIEDLRAARGKLIEQASGFETDAAVYAEHLLKMQVSATVLKQASAKLPDGLDLEALGKVAKVVDDATAGAMAAVEGAKGDSSTLENRLAEARAAGAAASAQLASLTKAQTPAVSSVEWETQLKAMSGPQVVAAFSRDEKALKDKRVELDATRDESKKAATAVAAARTKRDAIKDTFLLAAQDAQGAEKQKINGELRKEAGLEREVSQPVAPAPAKVAEPAGPSAPGPASAEKEAPKPSPLSALPKVSEDLAAFQQTVAGLVDVQDARDKQKTILTAAVAAAEQKATAYQKTLTEARQLVLQLYSTAIELKKRLGRDELTGDAVPEGITQGLQRDLINQLDADSAAVRDAQAQLQADAATLAKADPSADAAKTLTRDVLALVGQRLDLLHDLEALEADYMRPATDRTPTQAKMLKQRAADLMAQGSSGWDVLRGVSASDSTKNLSEILDGHYEELVELTDKEDNLRDRQEKVDQLIELTTKESAAIARMLPVLEEEITRLAARNEEETTLALARLDPGRADDLLRNFMTKTGRLLARPVPVPDQQKAEAVAALTDTLFENHVQLVALGKWRAQLDGRRGTSGLTAESGLYQQVQAELKARSATNGRRVQALAGNPLPEPTRAAAGTNPSPPASTTGSPVKLSVAGGEIARVRSALTRLRASELQTSSLQVLGVLVVAYLLHKILGWLCFPKPSKTAVAPGHLEVVKSTLGTIARLTVWMSAFFVILILLGVAVGPFFAGSLGVFGIGVAFAAQPTFTDIISSFIIFVERRYKIGDVIRLDAGEPAKVVSMTWRVSQLKNADGVLMNVPNQVITRSNLQKLTWNGKTCDSIDVTVSTTEELGEVQKVIREAMNECKYLTADLGASIREFNHKGDSKVIKYRFWWYLPDYELRNQTRDEVFTRISQSLAREHLAETEVSLS